MTGLKVISLPEADLSVRNYPEPLYPTGPQDDGYSLMIVRD